MLRAVLFDVDFTLSRPGPELGPAGYRTTGERFGLSLDPELYEKARLAAFADLRRHPELAHDEEIWITFTEDIVRGMGGDAPGSRECATAIVREWERHENFALYDDAIPALETMVDHALSIGLVSNGQRDLNAFVQHHGLAPYVGVAVGSQAHGYTKPHPSIFEAALDVLGVEPAHAAMVGDSYEDDIEGAQALGMRAVLLDRDGVNTTWEPRIRTLRELPAALGLEVSPRRSLHLE